MIEFCNHIFKVHKHTVMCFCNPISTLIMHFVNMTKIGLAHMKTDHLCTCDVYPLKGH